MNDDDATALIDRLAAGLPDTTPPPGLLVAGRSARHRRCKRLVAVAAAIVLVAVAGAVLPRFGPEAPPAGSRPFPDPPAGMKWVGIDRLVVAAPDDLEETPSSCVNAGLSDLDRPPPMMFCRASRDPRPGLRVYVGTLASSRDVAAALALGGHRTADGLTQLTLPCSGPSVLSCSRVVAAPEQGVFVKVPVTAALGADMIDSAMLLPEGWTTVPVGVTGDDHAVYSEAGLVVRSAEGSHNTEPAPGTPIEVGGTVTVPLINR